MDSANKQTAVIAEATVGTTPATPAFKLLRDVRVGGAPQRSSTRSPERRSDRQAAYMVTGLNAYPKTIELPHVRDDGLDVIWESAFGATWAANVLKIGSTQKTFTLEEKYEGGATDPYRRLTGCQVDSVSLNYQLGQPGSLVFNLKALAESTATTAIASSTYASPSPGYDPVSSVGITVNTLFGISSPKVTALQMTLTNNLREQYKMGSADPFGVGFGLFDLSGQVQLYFSALTDYSTFATRQTGQTFDITIGSQANYKDQLVMGAVDVWNPDVSDPGATGDHIVTLNFMARYYASDASAVKLTRNVA